MILNLLDLKKSGKTSKNFFFEYSPTENLIEIPNSTVVTPVKVYGTVIIVEDDKVILEGEIYFSVKGECTRCLEQTEISRVAQFYEELEEGNPDSYPIKSQRIDLKKIVDDAIIMNAPLNLLCEEGCKGICSGCGVNLNKEKCKCNNK